MSVRRGLFYSFAQTGGQFFIQFFSAIIIARLLPPSELGVAAVALAAITILEALREFGVQRYLIKEPDLTEDKIRTVFGVAILVSWLMAAFVLLSRHAIADFYGEPRLAAIFAVLSVCFMVLPIGLPGGGLLRRERRYKELSVIVLSATLANTLVSIACAFAGFGPISLAWGSLAFSSVLVAMTLVYRPDHIRLRPSLKEWRSIGGFGSLSSIEAAIMQIGQQLPQIMMGKAFAFADVGHYVRSQRLAMMVNGLFMNSVNFVTGAELGAKHRAGEDMRSMMLTATAYILVVAWPALVFLALEAHAVIGLLFGPNWVEAAPLLQALCLVQGIQMIVGQANSVYVATGDVRLKLRNEVVIQLCGLALLVIGLQFSVLAVAWLRVGYGLTFVLMHMTVLRKYVDVGLGVMMRTLRWPALVTAIFAAGLVMVQWAAPDSWSDTPLAVFPKGAAMAVIYVATMLAVRHPLIGEVQRIARRFPRRGEAR